MHRRSPLLTWRLPARVWYAGSGIPDADLDRLAELTAAGKEPPWAPGDEWLLFEPPGVTTGATVEADPFAALDAFCLIARPGPTQLDHLQTFVARFGPWGNCLRKDGHAPFDPLGVLSPTLAPLPADPLYDAEKAAAADPRQLMAAELGRAGRAAEARAARRVKLGLPEQVVPVPAHRRVEDRAGGTHRYRQPLAEWLPEIIGSAMKLNALRRIICAVGAQSVAPAALWRSLSGPPFLWDPAPATFEAQEQVVATILGLSPDRPGLRDAFHVTEHTGGQLEVFGVGGAIVVALIAELRSPGRVAACQVCGITWRPGRKRNRLMGGGLPVQCERCATRKRGADLRAKRRTP